MLSNLGMKILALMLGTMWGIATALASVMSPLMGATSPGGPEQVINHQTPITIAIALGGISLSFLLAWRVRGAFDDMKHEVNKLSDRIKYLEKKVDRLCAHPAIANHCPVPPNPSQS